MSTNIKLNPFNLVGKWNNEGLTWLGTELGGTPPTIQILAEKISEWVTGEVLYNATQLAPIDEVFTIGVVAKTSNVLSADSWCKDCCDNTFNSYEKLKKRVNEVSGFSQTQLTYINQIIGMPCNYNIDVHDFGKAIEQLETSVLTDTNISELEVLPVLMLLAVSRYSLEYWITECESGTSPWDAFFTPGPADDYIYYYAPRV